MSFCSRSFVAAAAAALAISSSALAGNNANQSGRVVPPNGSAYGRSMSDWTASWWQWAFSIRASENPLFDVSGKDVAVAQSGPVWFLAGVYDVSGTAVRSADVPSDRALFFPILNYVIDNVGVNPPLSVADMRSAMSDAVDQIDQLNVTIDGQSVPNLFERRTQAGPFSTELPPTDNLYQAFGVPFAGIDSPVLSDGYWMMLKPLAPGDHVIRFGGHSPGFTLDVTYNLHVVDVSQ